ncbi:MAG: hypothetical protein AAGF24_10665 [Cyanobacteria bacterium P01_H01_bin.121]
MQRFLRWLSRVGVLAIGASALLAAKPAEAQPAYGSYIGVGIGVGQRNNDGDALDLAGLAAFRYKFLELPVSLRSQLLVDDGSIAFVPTVSYDIPLSWQLEPYIGVGASFAQEGSIVGDKTSFVIQPGIDYAIPNSRVVIFGNAMIAIDAYNDSGPRDGDTAVSVQTGVGYRF